MGRPDPHDARRTAPLLTCEHGGNRIPPAWRERMAPLRDLLSTHRGWDPGALEAARTMAKACRAPLIAATTTRLLVDLNRSPHNPRVLSAVTRALPIEERRALLRRHHGPHWDRVRATIAELRRDRRTVIHVGVHSFTPTLDGHERRFDVALLYDPARRAEVRFCDRWLAAIAELDPSLRLRRNAPYRGAADGLVTALRREFPPRSYLGIELEINQALPLGDAARWRAVRRTLAESLNCAQSG